MSDRYKERIEQLELEIKDKETEIEISGPVRVKELEEENKCLQQTISSINDYTVTDSDEEFEDCSMNY